MEQLSSVIRQTMTDLNVPLEKRSLYLSVAVAKVVAYAQPLPTSRLESAITHYNETILASVEHTLAGINEATLIDIPVCLNLTFKFWLMRYRIAHEPTYVTVNTVLNSIAAADRLALAEVYSSLFTDGKDRTVDRLVGNVGALLATSYRKLLPDGATNV